MASENNEVHGHDDKKEITIIVNARPKVIDDKTLSFEEVVTLAFGAYDSNPEVIYVISYSDKNGNSSHELSKAQTVKAKEGMIFTVTPTNRS